jgi:hypothetical protein
MMMPMKGGANMTISTAVAAAAKNQEREYVFCSI